MRISDWSSDVCSSDLFVIVDLHLLQSADQRFLEIGRRDGLFRNFTQRDNRILVPVAINGQLGTSIDFPRTLSGKQDQVKTVCNLVDAIFDSNAGHVGSLEKSAKIESPTA